MFYNAKSKSVKIGNSTMSYVEFGTGEKNLIMIPGLGDGLRSDKKLAPFYALLYGKFAKAFAPSGLCQLCPRACGPGGCRA